MAAQLKSHASYAGLKAWRLIFEQRLNALKRLHARRKCYRRTYSEFARLSDRGLRDLGVSRSGIKRLAMEAADDC